ncbi:MerR family transcriptional regulator [Tateyamaria omphalii]|uniref:MerR family transcriptional regulator n=1 Tax=Tateyamaria omphalii TaxID=299262 RepID=UPI0021BD5BDC|nr:MerR family transcriptional regulator [Tateyamaria omphalii]
MTKSADAFRTISEVAEWLGVQTHVLRFWESKFTQVKPVKRAGGRRYYRPADMLLLGGIRKLLHEDGLTIKGVQKILREEGMAHVADMSPPLDAETDAQLDADLTARIAEDVAQPPVEAEVLPFAASPEQDETKAPSEEQAPPEAPATLDEPALSPVRGEEMAPLPSFLRTPTPSPDAQDSVQDDASVGLPYPPLVEDVPPASSFNTSSETFDEEPLPAEEQSAPERAEDPSGFVPHDTPPEAVDVQTENAAEPMMDFGEELIDSAAVEADAELPLAAATDTDAHDDTAVSQTAEPEPFATPDAAPAKEDTPEAFAEADGADAPDIDPDAQLEPEPGIETVQTVEADETAVSEAAEPPAGAEESPAAAPTLPTFLSDRGGSANETDVPEDALPEAEPAPESAPLPVARVVDVPDDPDPTTIAVSPSALSKAATLTQLSDAQRNMIRPLLAQLTALRDQMANNRREPR